MSLRAGVAVRNISPEKPIFLVGYPHVERDSTGIHDPLFATALALDDGSQKIVSVAVDILFVPHLLSREVRAELEKRSGVPAANIMISATHTHSGPHTNDILSWREDSIVPPPDSEYMEKFRQGIIEAASEALENMVDAEIATTTAYTEGVGCNRLSPDDVRDSEVGLVYLRTAQEHRPLALQMVYSMHPTVLHEDSTLVSSDFPGYTRLRLQNAFPGLRVLYHNGPCGNLSPRYHVKSQTFEEADRLGSLLAKQVKEALDNLRDDCFSSAISVAAKQKFIQLPPRDFGSVAEAERELEEAISDYERLQRENAGHGPVRTAECTVFGAEERATLARAQAEGLTQKILDEYLPVEVQVLQIGSTRLACLPGEAFVEYALEIKKRCAETFVVSLANGELQGYIPTPEATGYEARLSFFEPEAGMLFVEAISQLAGELA